MELVVLVDGGLPLSAFLLLTMVRSHTRELRR